MTREEIAEEVLLCVADGFNKWLKDMDENVTHTVIKQEEILGIADEFNKWLEDIAEKYKWDKDEVQSLIKQFLV